jgi:hypothetical protein
MREYTVTVYLFDDTPKTYEHVLNVQAAEGILLIYHANGDYTVTGISNLARWEQTLNEDDDS